MPEELKNWKTTAAGIAILALCVVFILGKISLDQFLAAFATLSAAGFAFAGDSKNKNG